MRPQENEYNKMVHELHKARQFCRFTAARGSRMYNWMSAQQGFIDHLKSDASTSAGSPLEESAEPFLPCKVLRPLTANSPGTQQLVLFKKNKSGLVTFHFGLVYGVYRGKVTRTVAATPRRLRVSKALAINAPVEAVSRALVLELKRLGEGDGSYVTSLVEPSHLLTPFLDIAAEVPYKEVGEKQGKLYFTVPAGTMAAFAKVVAGEIDPFAFAEAASDEAVPDATVSSSFDGFHIGDFTKNEAGRKKIQAFFKQLPRAYSSHEINFLVSRLCCVFIPCSLLTPILLIIFDFLLILVLLALFCCVFCLLAACCICSNMF